MNTLDQEIAQRKDQKFKTLTRIKIGRGLMIYAALPLMSAWAFIPGLILSMPLSPSVFAKKKLIELKEWRRLSWN